MGSCIICKKKLNKHMATFDNMPAAAQNMPDGEQIKKDAGMTLQLYQCTGCGLVQFDAEPVDYYKDVIRATGVSDKFRELRRQQFRHFIELCKLENKRIVEVGCGAGEFLEILEEFPVKAYGVEHKLALVEAAQKKGLEVNNGFVGNAEASLEHAPFDAFISFNFLEHQPDPVGMLQGICENLTESGAGLITVPSYEYFVEHSSYYEFIRDHIAYYTEDTLCRLLELCGFEVLETARFNKDTIEAIVKKRSWVSPVDYHKQKETMELEFAKILAAYDAEDAVFVWGASHQAFTLLSTIPSLQRINKIIDSADFKWDKYSPASHIPIVSPEVLDSETPKCIIIMAPGYSDEIYKMILSRNAEIECIYTVMGERIIKLK